MKKYLSLLCLTFLFVWNFANIYWAETWWQPATGFELSVKPTSTKIWEAVDLTVKAVDKSWKVVKDYQWVVYVTVENDNKATVPYSEWYQFTPEDLWQKTFSKWLTFTKEWTMKVVVLDIENEQMEWSVDVKVWAWETSNNSAATWDLTITSPDNWMTVPWDAVTISWVGKKNSKVKFLLNWKEVTDLATQSDEKWNFSVEMTWLWENNVIEVKVVDWSDKTIAQSEKITVTTESSWPVFKNVTIKEWKEAPISSQINISVTADSWLKEVTASLWEDSQNLTESTSNPWVYEWKLTLPNASWDYPIDIFIKNELWKTTSKKAAIKIKALESNVFMNIKAIAEDRKVSFNFSVNPDKPEYKKFKIKYWTAPDTLKTEWDTQVKESISFEKEKIKDWAWYKWYINWLDPAVWKYYFQFFPVDVDWKEISWIKSDIVEVAFWLLSAGGNCTISNIGWLKAKKNWDVMELTWNSLPEVTWYNVYKKSKDGFTLIENVKINKYTINISWDKIKYEEFAVKATCWNWENASESKDFSNATKVQTWPAQIAIIVGLSMIISFFVLRRRSSK